MALLPGNPVCHSGFLVGSGLSKGQMIPGVLTQVHLTVESILWAKVKWQYLKLSPALAKRRNQKQCYITGGMAEISTEVVIFTISLSDIPLYPLGKKSWWTILDHQKLNQVVDSATAAVPDMVSLLDSFNTWYGCGKCIPFSPHQKGDQRQLDDLIAHSARMKSNTHWSSCQGL